MKANEYFDRLLGQLQNKGDSNIAIQQARYMKDQFEFLGLKAGPLKEQLRIFRQENSLPDPDQLDDLCRLCFACQYREVQYCALEITKRSIKKVPEEFIRTLEWMVVNESWWDSVDALAGLIGEHLTRYPELQPRTTDGYNTCDNMWLVRVSIIFQLKYRDQTNFNLLTRYILNHKESKEFFIRKAQGWALRQYSKFQPEKVRAFIEAHPELSGLTRREASKYL